MALDRRDHLVSRRCGPPELSYVLTQPATAIREIDATGISEWHALSVTVARRVEEEVVAAGSRPDVAFVRDVAFEGPVGEVPVRVYRHEVNTPAPTLVFYHGGGWTPGTLDSIGGFCRTLVRRTGCVVVSVDYHLAPEHPFSTGSRMCGRCSTGLPTTRPRSVVIRTASASPKRVREPTSPQR